MSAPPLWVLNLAAWSLQVVALALVTAVLEHILPIERPRARLALLQSLGGVEGESLIRLVYAEALIADGDHEAGRLAIDEARTKLLERARRIEDDELRATFLTAVWENARTLELASSAGSRRSTTE